LVKLIIISIDALDKKLLLLHEPPIDLPTLHGRMRTSLRHPSIPIHHSDICLMVNSEGEQ